MSCDFDALAPEVLQVELVCQEVGRGATAESTLPRGTINAETSRKWLFICSQPTCSRSNAPVDVLVQDVDKAQRRSLAGLALFEGQTEPGLVTELQWDLRRLFKTNGISRIFRREDAFSFQLDSMQQQPTTQAISATAVVNTPHRSLLFP